MKVTYDSDIDAMYIRLSESKSERQQEFNEGDIVLDLDSSGNIIGLEILDAIKNYGHDILNFNLSLLGAPHKAERIEYTTEEAAEILMVNKETLLRKIRTGSLKATKLGKTYRIPKSEITKLTTP
ncbi:MAG: hypothetical protein H6Q71_2734 [Firmicutes bacterium]|nr:hypothetical protein [Bacillota bacterium]